MILTLGAVRSHYELSLRAREDYDYMNATDTTHTWPTFGDASHARFRQIWCILLPFALSANTPDYWFNYLNVVATAIVSILLMVGSRQSIV